MLYGVSLAVGPGEVHALLGANGAGKSTLLRMFAGMVGPSAGSLSVLGHPPGSRQARGSTGWLPSGERNFYYRLSGLENLVFFGRLLGLTRRSASARGRDLLAAVGLADAANRRVGLYSHGMQKRLGVARALMGAPPVLLLDEPTHDLDPDAAKQIRGLIRATADDGAAIIWTTQLVDEVRGVADDVTVLVEGRTGFNGSVAALVRTATARRYQVRLRNGSATPPAPHVLTAVLDGMGVVEGGGGDEYVLHLLQDVVLGDAIARLSAAHVSVLACREERSEIEQALTQLQAVSS